MTTEKTIQEQIDRLINLGALNRVHVKMVLEQHALYPNMTALDIIEQKGVRNLTHLPLDLEDRIYKTIMEGCPDGSFKGFQFETHAYLYGLPGFQRTVLSRLMVALKGRVPPVRVLEEVEKLRDDKRFNWLIHPGKKILLNPDPTFRVVCPKLIHEVEELCAKNDKAHRMDHVYGCVALAELLVRKNTDLQPWRKAILAATLLHDIAHHEGRVNHHNAGADKAKVLLAKYMPDDWSPAELRLIDSAIRTHRSSFKEKRDHIVQDAVAAADLGIPDWRRIAIRAMIYQIDHAIKSGEVSPLSIKSHEVRQKLITQAIEHIREKFGVNGYAWANVNHFTWVTWRDDVQDTQVYCTDGLALREFFLVDGGYEKAALKATLYSTQEIPAKFTFIEAGIPDVSRLQK